MLEGIHASLRKRYVRKLMRRGLRVGRNVYLNDGFFLDPAHCHLIAIDDDVVLGPGVRLFAHDASSLKVIGKTRIGLVHLRRNCFVGAGSIILPDSSVGEGSILGAGSMLSGHVPDGEVWAGNPARRLMSVDDYRRKLLALPGNDFPEDLYRMDAMNSQRRLEMIESLKAIRTGFMAPWRSGRELPGNSPRP